MKTQCGQMEAPKSLLRGLSPKKVPIALVVPPGESIATSD